MAQTTQTWFTTTLAKKLLPWDTTMELATAPTITKWRCKVNVGDNSEWVKFTGLTGSTLTGLVRGLSKTAVPATSGTGLTHPAGTVVKIVIMHDQLLDKQEDESLSWIITVPSIRFSDTTTSWLRLKSLTEVQRDALTPAIWDKIINSTTGTEQTYYGGTWNDAGTSTTANASPTVAGKWQVWTDTQFTNGTLVWSTWATLWATLVQLAKSILLKPTTSTTSDTYLFGVNNGTVDQKITQLLLRDQILASTTQRWFGRNLTDAEAKTWSTAWMVSWDQLKNWSWYTLLAWWPTIYSNAWWPTTTSSSYVKVRTISINATWTITFSFSWSTNSWSTDWSIQVRRWGTTLWTSSNFNSGWWSLALTALSVTGTTTTPDLIDVYIANFSGTNTTTLWNISWVAYIIPGSLSITTTL